MRNINTAADLKDAISELEFNKAVHRRMLKDSFNSTIENLKPGNVIKNIGQALFNPGVLSNVLPAAMGAGIGYLSNMLIGTVASVSHGNRIRKVLIGLALYGVTRVLTKNRGMEGLFGKKIVDSILNR
jgi:hypothetical protein